jgi:hypothetical protein
MNFNNPNINYKENHNIAIYPEIYSQWIEILKQKFGYCKIACVKECKTIIENLLFNIVSTSNVS